MAAFGQLARPAPVRPGGTSKLGVLELRRGSGILVAGTPERGTVAQRARELVGFAGGQGYRLDELVEIIPYGMGTAGSGILDPMRHVRDDRGAAGSS